MRLNYNEMFHSLLNIFYSTKLCVPLLISHTGVQPLHIGRHLSRESQGFVSVQAATIQLIFGLHSEKQKMKKGLGFMNFIRLKWVKCRF